MTCGGRQEPGTLLEHEREAGKFIIPVPSRTTVIKNILHQDPIGKPKNVYEE
jgi:hypothetical protein